MVNINKTPRKTRRTSIWAWSLAFTAPHIPPTHPDTNEMAPVSPIKRVTRARAAAKSTTEDTTAKKIGTTKVTKTSTTKPAATKPAARKTRAASNEPLEEIVEVELPKKTTRTTKAAAPLAAAPRRRIKVTPLDAPIPEEPIQENQPEKTAKKTSSRSKKASEAEVADEKDESAPAKTRTKSTKTPGTNATTMRKAAPAVDAEVSIPKTRGKSRKTKKVADTTARELEPAQQTRQTRARSASIISQPPNDVIEYLPPAKTGPRKKVTFQDLPEDDKENEPVAPRRAAAKKASTTAGMRAKPVRKPAASATKGVSTTRTRAAKLMPRALTPKKVTQIAQSLTPDGSEDELNGAKTPVRDLTLSPTRNPVLAAQLSPSKKLDFNQSLLARSPQKSADSGALLSPARRPSSPVKSAGTASPLKESPRRGGILPGNAPNTDAAVFATSATSGLLQSPKRGMLDTSMFSQSAIKQKQSPLKASLLQSPARRLFSPAKSRTPLSVHRDADDTMTGMEVIEDIAVSSHFRPSMSPQRSTRVHTMSDEELADELAMDMDFDQSILKLTSPRKSPVKIARPVLSEILDEEPEMPTIQYDAEETAKAVEELQASDEDQAMASEEVTDSEEVVEPAQMSISATDESSAASDQNKSTNDHPATLQKAPRLSQILFRSNRFREDDESSEDELAADETPDRAPRLFRSSLTGPKPRSRLCTAQQSNAGNVGFTPLAAQISGWLANSPEKSPAKAAIKSTPTKGLFSPLAAQHVPGSIQINRHSTPMQSKHSPAMRSSVNSRPSLSASALGSPDKSTFFAEQMLSMVDDNVIEEAEDLIDGMDVEADEPTTQSLVAAENDALRAELQEEDESTVLNEEDTVIVHRAPEELTTDLINEVHSSDTAMVDFQELAHEAESLAGDGDVEIDSTPESVYGDENVPPEETLNLSVTENAANIVEDPTLNLHTLEQNLVDDDSVMYSPAPSTTAHEDPTLNLHVLEENGTARSTSATPVASRFVTVEDPTLNFSVLENAAVEAAAATPASLHSIADEPTLNLHVLENNAMVRSPVSTTSPVTTVVDSEHELVTPRPILLGPRVVNTVVSKVPLKPASDMSPIKMPKKRSRSMSMSDQQSPPKRPQLAPLGGFTPARSTSAPDVSPQRTIRSAAPSPAHTTPGQMSFAVDDFGDSTLDGIEIPDDEMDFEVTRPNDTPSTVKSVKTAKSAAPTPSRAPLEAVNGGVLHGAVIYVEVHTSEGADASGVYIDLLTQMGARCVRDWRWNSRASVHAGDDLTTAGKPGVTHVVYKDGGKRTLEKVRDAKGEVWCVGVRWVLE